ncbi:MAG: glycine betaine ABC transporter substrate-binding protein [Nocardioidaceae bacterium]
MKRHGWIALLVALALAGLALAACGSDDDGGGGGSQTSGAQQSGIKRNSANASTSITVGSKNFTEQRVLGEIYAQALAAAGYKVKTELNLGDEKIALKALETEQIDAYPEYTGTALLSFFGFKASELPKDPQKAYQEVKANFAKRGIEALPPTPFTSSNEVAVTRATANKYGLKKISDLSKVASKLTLYGSPECRQRLDCLLGLQQVYGLEFKKFVPVAVDLRHEVLRKGQADVSIVFTTDPQIKRNDEVLLEDDKGMFPPYNSTLLVRDEVAQKAGPDLRDVVTQVNEGLTVPAMQELNARVDLDKKTPTVVGREYLQETGLIE